MIEIGPGGGVLTRELLRSGARVIAVELDRDWAFETARRLDAEGLQLIVGDAQDLGWSRLEAGTLVAGNLPFAIATRLIDRVLAHGDRIPRAGFMVQSEVADRLLATPGRKAYGALTVLTAARANASLLSRIAPGSFVPRPEVGAAFVGLELKMPVVGVDAWRDFESLVYLAFSQRRKQLRNGLASRWGRRRADEVLERAALPADCRAEQLSLDQFLRLFGILYPRVESAEWA